MSLSEAAIQFLATLERLPHVPTRQVESILLAAGQPCFEPWLAFHDQFAGYVERMGRDVAVWGLMHERPQWLSPLEADIEPEKDGVTLYITCADVHPSYSYQLDNKGEFLGFPAECFATHVERAGAGSAFKGSSETEAITQAELRDPAFMARLGPENVLAPASDSFFNYHEDGDILVVWRHGAPTPQRGWRRL